VVVLRQNGPSEKLKRAFRMNPDVGIGPVRLTFTQTARIIATMTKPEAVRRIKSYSAANGYVYQYCFFEVNRVLLDDTPAGEFIYAISADRATSFGLRIFVLQPALEAWARANGRALTSSEEYAVAKMRLFQAFDEGMVPRTREGAAELRLVVDESNLEELLRALNI